MTAYDTIVIGVGAMGAAACDSLARRGLRVLGLERFGVPNTMGSHHGHTRAFRVAYAEHRDYVPLLREAREAWIELDTDADSPIYNECGLFYAGPKRCALMTATASSAQDHGIPMERLSGEDAFRRFPQFRLSDGDEALFEPQAGFLAAEGSVAAMAERALSAGADLRCEAVTGWSVAGGGVGVRTDRAEYHAGSLVVTAGAWTSRLLDSIGFALAVSRQALCWTWPKSPEDFSPDRFPVWAIETPLGIGYGFPRASGRPGIKTAIHAPGETVDPDASRAAPSSAETEPVLEILRDRVPRAGRLIASASCLYTNTIDGHFVLDRHPRHPNVVFAAGFSGHGFKFAPVLGEALADLAIDGITSRPIGFLCASRFGSASP